MTNRREFLQIGIAATAWPIASHAAFGAVPAQGATAAAATPTVPLYKAIYDTRFPESVAFGRRMEARGVSTQAIEGDMTHFWFTDLDLRWRKAPAAIAGLTAHGPLFCLEQLAWQHGMRVVFRADHTIDADGRVQHALNGPAAMLNSNDTLAAPDWAASMADLAARCPMGRSQLSTASLQGPKAVTALAHGDRLISWVIAPAAKA